MRKLVLVLLLLPTFFMVVSGAANAQRRNIASPKVKTIEQHLERKKNIRDYKKEMNKNCGNNCKYYKKYKKKHRDK